MCPLALTYTDILKMETGLESADFSQQWETKRHGEP